MADLVGRVLGMATGVGIVQTILGHGSWLVVVILALATAAWTIGQVLLNDGGGS